MQPFALENKRGFTLIELVIVIVLIGIIAATALPKFANLTTQAEIAASQDFVGALSSAVNIVHAAWIVAGANSVNATTIALEGTSTTVFVNNTGWPAGSNNAIGPAGASDCVNLLNSTTGAIMNNPPFVVAASVGITCAGCVGVTGTCYDAVWSPGVGNSQRCFYTACYNGVGVSGPIVIEYNGQNGAVTSSNVIPG